MAIIDNDLFTQINPNPNSPRNNPSLAGQLTNLNNEVNSIEDTLVQGYVRESASVSYVSSSSFTVSGNVTAIYTNGRIVRFSDGTTGIVSSSSYSSTTGKTTVTMLTGTVPSSLSYVDIAIQARGLTSGLASRVLGDNNVAVVSQKDSAGTEREILKVDNNNKFIVGNDDLTTSLKLKIFTATQNNYINSSTATLVDLPGASLDLEAGTYLVIANFQSARVWTSAGTPPRVAQARYCVRDSNNNVLLNCWDTIAQYDEIRPREIGKVLVGVITLSSPTTIKMSGYINVQNGTNFASGFRIDSGSDGVQWSNLTAIRLT